LIFCKPGPTGNGSAVVRSEEGRSSSLGAPKKRGTNQKTRTSHSIRGEGKIFASEVREGPRLVAKQRPCERQKERRMQERTAPEGTLHSKLNQRCSIEAAARPRGGEKKRVISSSVRGGGKAQTEKDFAREKSYFSVSGGIFPLLKMEKPLA